MIVPWQKAKTVLRRLCMFPSGCADSQLPTIIAAGEALKEKHAGPRNAQSSTSCSQGCYVVMTERGRS